MRSYNISSVKFCMSNTNALNRIWDYGRPKHKFLSIHVERQRKQAWPSPHAGTPFSSPLLPEELHGTNVCIGLSHCFLQQSVPEHQACLIVWLTSLSGQQFRALTCSCHKNPATLLDVLSADSRSSTEALTAALTSQLGSLGSLLSWTIIYSPSAVCWWDWKDMVTSWV